MTSVTDLTQGEKGPAFLERMGFERMHVTSHRHQLETYWCNLLAYQARLIGVRDGAGLDPSTQLGVHRCGEVARVVVRLRLL
eukprot:jgi/Tetstr1/457287/TSEL_043892.t1